MTQVKTLTIIDKLLLIFNTILHVIIGLSSGFLFYTFFKYKEYYRLTRFLHVFLSTLAYVPLMAESLLIFSEYNVWTVQFSRNIKSLIHGVFLGCSVIIATVGISIKINRNLGIGYPNFVSYHAILGLASWLLSMISVLGGLLALYSPKLKPLVRPVVVKLIHTLLGLVSFVLGMASLILGLDLPAFNDFTTQNEKRVMIVSLSLVTIFCSTRIIRSGFNQFKAVLT